MGVLPKLIQQKRYLKFCYKYRHNLLRFVVDISGKNPTWQQNQLMIAMQQPSFRVSCVSGHGVGKSWCYGWFILWHVTVYPFSNLLLTGNNITQLRKIVWKELADAIERLFSIYPWLEPYFKKESMCFYATGYKDGWFAIPATAPKNEPENLAGQHRDKYTVLCDEASKLPDDLIGVLKGALTGVDNSFAMISQGTRPNGAFYDSHHSLRNLYKTFKFDSELSPIVNKAWIEEKLQEYGGFLAADYQIKVKGAFPDQLEGMLIARSWAEQCSLNKVQHREPPGLVILCDISGYGHDSTVYLVAEVSGYEENRRLNTVELQIHTGVSKGPDRVKQIKALYLKYEHLNPTLGVDFQGIGSDTFDHLEAQGVPVEKVISGNPATYKERFLNLRAEWAWWTRDAVFYNHLSFKGISRNMLEKVYDEFGKIPYRITEKGAMKLWSKEQMKNIQGIRSPDIFDVYSYAMGMDYVAMDVEEQNSEHFNPTTMYNVILP